MLSTRSCVTAGPRPPPPTTPRSSRSAPTGRPRWRRSPRSTSVSGLEARQVAVEEAVEEVTPGPLRSLGRHTLVSGSGYVASAAVSLLLVPVYTHTFTPGE